MSGRNNLSETTLLDPAILAHPADFYAAMRKDDPLQLVCANPETGEDCQNILGFSAPMRRAGETLRLAARSPAAVFHPIESEADLSCFYDLELGDLICTGTPKGVGPVVSGDHTEGRVEGVGEISLLIGPAE
jgi:hypothetical protein